MARVDGSQTDRETKRRQTNILLNLLLFA